MRKQRKKKQIEKNRKSKIVRTKKQIRGNTEVRAN